MESNQSINQYLYIYLYTLIYTCLYLFILVYIYNCAYRRVYTSASEGWRVWAKLARRWEMGEKGNNNQLELEKKWKMWRKINVTWTNVWQDVWQVVQQGMWLVTPHVSDSQLLCLCVQQAYGCTKHANPWPATSEPALVPRAPAPAAARVLSRSIDPVLATVFQPVPELLGRVLFQSRKKSSSAG